jgi:hypothetical protein
VRNPTWQSHQTNQYRPLCRRRIIKGWFNKRPIKKKAQAGRPVGRDREVLPVAIFDRDCWWRDVALSGLEAAGRHYRIAVTSESTVGVRAAVSTGIAAGLLSAGETRPNWSLCRIWISGTGLFSFYGAGRGPPAIFAMRCARQFAEPFESTEFEATGRYCDGASGAANRIERLAVLNSA